MARWSDRLLTSFRTSKTPLGGEKVPEEPAPYWIRGRMRGRRGDDSRVERFVIKNVVPIQRTKVSGLGSPLARPLGTFSPSYGERE